MTGTPSTRPERRRFPRRLLATRIDLSEPHDAGFFSGMTLNVSLEGVAVRTRETVPEVGARLDFGYRLQADRQPFRGSLEIAWVRPFEGPDGDHQFGARVTSWHGEEPSILTGGADEDDDDPTHPAVRSSTATETGP